jgi:hypothetical protein
MQCYYHSDHEAIGLCKACQRGLCRDCAVDLEVALACRDRHEPAVRTLIQINQNAAAFGTSFRKSRFFAPGFFILMGLLFGGWTYSSEEPISFGTTIGFFFTVFGVVLLFIHLRTARRMDDDA